MSSERLRHRIEQLRTSYQNARGATFSHFVCPILRTDENVPLCEGHVIPAAFGACNTWVPQRKDVDNFYGSVAEADFIGVVQHRLKTPFEKWIDPSLRKHYRPKMKVGEKNISCYFPMGAMTLAGQTPGKVIVEGKAIADLVIKESPEAVKALDGQELRIVIDQDYRPAVVASILKAAHLTLFHLLGYGHVFSADGMYLADILGDFFVSNHKTDKKDLEDEMANYFLPYMRMIAPMLIRDSSVLRGTVFDNRVIGCIGGSQGLFACGVIIPAGDDRFCVFLPSGHAQTIDTYLSFLNDPPSSFGAKLFEFCPAEAQHESYWKTGNDDPMRIPLPDRLPTS